jgi:hypothetical protein
MDVNDIIIADPIQWVKAKPEYFFHSGVPTPMELINLLVVEVLVLGHGSCTIRPTENWWIIGSEIDWLQNDKYSEEELFKRIVPAPQFGDNSMRAEILVACYARSVWLTLDGQRKCIKGDKVPESVWIKTSDLYRAMVFEM